VTTRRVFVVIECRSAEDKLERFPALAAELVALTVDVIVAPNTPATLAAKQATDLDQLLIDLPQGGLMGGRHRWLGADAPRNPYADAHKIGGLY
jgi:hypothetical protein